MSQARPRARGPLAPDRRRRICIWDLGGVGTKAALSAPVSRLEMEDFFRRVAHRASCVVGSAWAFSVALAVVFAWAASGPLFHFSDTWQLVINTATTVVTFLMVFVIQNSQNRDAKATLLKLDELIRAQTGARNRLINLEGMTENELAHLETEFKRLRESESGRPTQQHVSNLNDEKKPKNFIQKETSQ